MYDIIFLYEHENYDVSIKQYLKANYAVTNLDYDVKEVTTIAGSNRIRLIVAWIENLSNDSMSRFRRIISSLKDVYFVMLGSKYSYSLYNPDGSKENMCYIDVPVSVTEFGEKFTDIAEKKACLMVNADAKDPRKHILLVDDDPVCLRNMMNWLEGFYKVSVAKSGAAAISFLSKQKPDLILLDYEMPVCNGVQTLEMIRAEEEYSDIPVIFLTAVSDSKLVVEALKHKPQGYVLKGTDRIEFLNKINMYL